MQARSNCRSIQSGKSAPRKCWINPLILSCHPIRSFVIGKTRIGIISNSQLGELNSGSDTVLGVKSA